MNIYTVSKKVRNLTYWLDSKGYYRTGNVVWNFFYRARKAIYGGI